VEAPKDIVIPQDLITEEVIQKKIEQLKPTWIPVNFDTTRQDTLTELQLQINNARKGQTESPWAMCRGKTGVLDGLTESSGCIDDGMVVNGESEEVKRKRRKADSDARFRLIHKPSGIVFTELSNGIRINYRYSSYYQKRCFIRVAR